MTTPWQTTISRGEFVAAHPNPREQPNANWGHQTLRLKPNGHFELWNSRFPGQPGGLGTYSVHGNEITYLPTGTVSMGAGETWRYTWNRYRDTLTFKRVGKGASPTGFVVKAWHLVR